MAYLLLMQGESEHKRGKDAFHQSNKRESAQQIGNRVLCERAVTNIKAKDPHRDELGASTGKKLGCLGFGTGQDEPLDAVMFNAEYQMSSSVKLRTNILEMVLENRGDPSVEVRTFCLNSSRVTPNVLLLNQISILLQTYTTIFSLDSERKFLQKGA